MRKNIMPLEDRRALVCSGKPITLDGHRATIGGWRNDFATVHDFETGLSVEFAWETVKHVMERAEGRFRS